MAQRFNGTRLRLARQLHGLTQREFGERVALTNGAITHLESGDRQPREKLVVALADALKVSPAFLLAEGGELFTPSQLNFRDHITATERLRKRVIAYANFFAMAVQHLRLEVDFPELALPDLAAGLDMEQVAEASRSFWGISPNIPIDRMSRVLENAGVIITPLRLSADDTKHVDALSGYADTNVVIVNVTKESTSRSRFGMAHELLHGISHRARPFRLLEEKEKEANAFAGAFLLPRDAFTRDFRVSIPGGLDGLLEMKLRWGVSIQAILMRANALGLINAAELRVWFSTLSRRGWRRMEPGERAPENESPELFASGVTAFGADPAVTLSKDLGWSLEVLELVTGVTAASKESEGFSSEIVDLAAWRPRREANSA